jgi:DNA-binding response OmpR family regulator
MSVVLLSADLMAVSRVEGAAAKAGKTVRAVTTAEQAVQACRAAGATMLVVDLAAPALDVACLVRDVKAAEEASPLVVVAFGPHVHTELLAAAHEAGCDEVVSRGQFFAHVDAILRRGSSVAR